MEQDDGAWVLHSVVDPRGKHLPKVVLLLGKFVANNAQYVHVQGDGGLNKQMEKDECGRGIPRCRQGTEGRVPGWCLVLGPRAGH